MYSTVHSPWYSTVGVEDHFFSLESSTKLWRQSERLRIVIPLESTYQFIGSSLQIKLADWWNVQNGVQQVFRRFIKQLDVS